MAKEILKEEQGVTVNDEQLQNLYDAAAKTEGQIINLAVASMKFSNNDIKRAVTSLKSQANQLTELIAKAIEDSAGVNLGMSSEEEVGGPIDLDAQPDAANMIESVNNIDGENLNESITLAKAFVMNKLNFSPQQVESLTISQLTKLKEAFNPADIFKADKKKAGPEVLEEKNVEIREEEDVMEEAKEIDICEPYKKIEEGLSVKQFGVFKTGLIEALSGKKFDDVFQTIVESIKTAKDIKSLNEAIDNLYDYADANEITVKTK